MAFTDRTKISQYDATAANNINLGTAASPAARLGEYGVDADAEAMRPSDTNGALRELMAHLKAMDVGTNPLTTPNLGEPTADVIGLNTSYIEDGNEAQGSIFWNSDELTANLVQNGTILQVGQEIQINVRNSTGSDIADGSAVMATGTLGASGRITIGLMDASSAANAKMFIGIATETITAGGDGKVTWFGKVRDINTSGFTQPSILWCDPATAGGLTETQPSAPNAKLAVAYVIYSATAQNGGTIFVRGTPGQLLSECHDVEITGTPADNEVLAYDTTTGAFINQTAAEAGLESLEAISASITATAVDVFVYDTSKDSDGGAWRKRCQHTSWYNETLNTATRGSRREFPAVAVIVAEATKVTIYDGDDPSLPMWMVFVMSSGNNALSGTGGINSVTAKNGLVLRGSTPTNSYDLVGLHFIIDGAARIGASGVYGPYQGNLAERNDAKAYVNGVATFFGSGQIVNRTVNDVAMTVLPDAPTDPATGLPVPTIAVATDGGVSVIKDDGTVVDSSDTYAVKAVNFDANKFLWYPRDGGSTQRYSQTYDADGFQGRNWQDGTLFPTVFASASTITVASNTDDHVVLGSKNTNQGISRLSVNPSAESSSMVAYTTSTYNTGWLPGDIKGAFLSSTDTTSLVGSGELVTNGTFDTDTSGWTAARAAVLSVSSGAMVITYGGTDYPQAQQTITTIAGQRYKLKVTQVSGVSLSAVVGTSAGGNQLGAVTGTGSLTLDFVATSTTSYLTLQANATGSVSVTVDNISVKLADADRSVNNNGLIVNGTVTRSAVATGAELVAYSGFSASNYLEQPYNSALDFGTGDFCVMGWIKQAANTAVETILERDSATTAQRFTLAVDASGFLTFTCDDDTTARTSTSNRVVDTDTWTHFAAIYDGAGNVSLYLDGALDDTETGSALLTLNNTAAVLSVGLAVDGAEPLTNGDVALLRISATVPTAAQIAKIYEDEKFLFQDNAACTLYGASDAVTALAHDPDTNLLHVGTSAGRSVFQGLRRVDNTTTAVETAISASGALVAEE